MEDGVGDQVAEARDVALEEDARFMFVLLLGEWSYFTIAEIVSSVRSNVKR